MAGSQSSAESRVRFSWRLGASLAAIIALAVTANWLARSWSSMQSDYQRVAPAVDCDFNAGPCLQRWQERTVALRVEPPEVPLMQPLRLVVDLGGSEATAVHVAVRGLNMDMGLNRTTLRREGQGRWVGETILPICSQRHMKWEAAVELVAQDRVEIPFAFSTRR